MMNARALELLVIEFDSKNPEHLRMALMLLQLQQKNHIALTQTLDVPILMTTAVVTRKLPLADLRHQKNPPKALGELMNDGSQLSTLDAARRDSHIRKALASGGNGLGDFVMRDAELSCLHAQQRLRLFQNNPHHQAAMRNIMAALPAEVQRRNDEREQHQEPQINLMKP